MYKTTGRVKVVNDTIQITEKFAKREFVLVDNSSMYEQEIMFQFSQDKCSSLDGIQEGDQVEVSWNLNGRMWTNPQGEEKYFNTLGAWRIEKMGGEATDTHTSGIHKAGEPIEQIAEDDDLPF
jgi:hypothetical protein